MHQIDTIINPILLIENNHLNLYNTKFDDYSLLNFTNKVKNYKFICNMVSYMRSSQELTESQKNIMKQCFPNLKLFSVEKKEPKTY